MTLIEAPQGALFVPPQPEPAPQLRATDVEAICDHVRVVLPGLITDPADVTNKLAIPLEHPFMVPSSQSVEGFSYGDQQFRWDSYFHARLLMLMDREQGFPRNSLYFQTTVGMIDNALSMYERFGVIPNSSLYIRLGHGQPPLETSYVFEVYDTYKDVHPDVITPQWVTDRIAVLKHEYETVWKGTRDPHNRSVYRGLSRYYDPDVTDDHVQAESGHDYSPRFNGHAYDMLPPDLNAMLYKVEVDFAREAGMRGAKVEMDYWLKVAQTRKETMNELMYDPAKGVFHDYNYRTGRWGPVDSLASYTTMWAGMVEPGSEQAAQMRNALHLFEHSGGVAVTEKYRKPYWERRRLQWGYPNSFSPTTILTTDGLEIAGYPDDARRIALKSLAAKVSWYNKHGVVLEAMNAVHPTRMPAPGMYPRQVGFGFSDAEVRYHATRYVDGTHLPAVMMRGAVLLDPPGNPA